MATIYNMPYYYYPPQSNSYFPFDHDSFSPQLAQPLPSRRFGFPGARFPGHQGFHAHHAHPSFARGLHPHLYTSPVHAPSFDDDLYEQEQAARAHLEFIQQRRQQVEAAAEQERIRERELLAEEIRRQIRELEVERQREAAQERERQRMAAQERERQREVAASAIAAATRACAAEIERRQRIAEALNDRRRQPCTRHRATFATQSPQQCQRFFPPAVNFFQQLQQPQCQPEQRQADKEVAAASQLDQLNKCLNLFGINLVANNAKEESSQPTNAKEESSQPTATIAECSSTPEEETTKVTEPSTESKQALPKEINDVLSAILGLRVEPTSSDAESSSAGAKRGIPAGLNELLGQFGLEFVPDQAEDKKHEEKEKKNDEKEKKSEVIDTATRPAVAAADPETPVLTTSTPAPTVPSSAPALSSSPVVTTSAHAPTPAATTASNQERSTPFTDLLTNYTDLNPFVREILATIERSFGDQNSGQGGPQASTVAEERRSPREACQRRRDKGKGVAEGEKKALTEVPPVSTVPAPSTSETSAAESTDTKSNSSASSLSQLEKIAAELESLKASFVFPTKLSFGNTPTTDDTPTLLFNRTNSSYHAQANALLQLLLAADSVSSGGDRSVRSRRKALVKSVEAAIVELEKKRDQIWKEVKERRERDESDDEDEARHTSGSSSNSDVEHELDIEESFAKAENVTKADIGTEVPVDETSTVEHVENVESVPEVVEPEEEVEESKEEVEESKEEVEESKEVEESNKAAEEVVEANQVAEESKKVKNPTVSEENEESYELL